MTFWHSLMRSQGDATSSLVGVDRSVVVHGDGGPRFELWVGGTPSRHEGDAVHLPVDEEDTEFLDGSTVGEEEVPHSIPDTAVEVVAPGGPALREVLERLDMVCVKRGSDANSPEVPLWPFSKRTDI